MGIVEKNIKLGRSSNFELLRIIAMAMIVYSHFFIHANIVITISSLSDINLRVLLEHFFKLNLESISIINKMAETSFGVYLICDNLRNDVAVNCKYFTIYAICGEINYL